MHGIGSGRGKKTRAGIGVVRVTHRHIGAHGPVVEQGCPARSSDVAATRDRVRHVNDALPGGGIKGSTQNGRTIRLYPLRPSRQSKVELARYAVAVHHLPYIDFHASLVGS